MKFYSIYICVLLLFFSCNDNKKEERKIHNDLHFSTSSYNPIYYPKINGDSFLYIGTVEYSSTLDHFDTLYQDTIVIYRLHGDSFAYKLKEVKYKWLTSRIDLSFLKDTLNINAKTNDYQYNFLGQYVTNKVTFIFQGNDSLYFQDNFESITDKIKEKHTFKTKRLD